MAYVARTIKDRVAVGDDIFQVEDLGNNKIRLTPTPTHISEAGTPVNKALLQPIEDYLASISDETKQAIEDYLASISDETKQAMYATNMPTYDEFLVKLDDHEWVNRAINSPLTFGSILMYPGGLSTIRNNGIAMSTLASNSRLVNHLVADKTYTEVLINRTLPYTYDSISMNHNSVDGFLIFAPDDYIGDPSSVSASMYMDFTDKSVLRVRVSSSYEGASQYLNRSKAFVAIGSSKIMTLDGGNKSLRYVDIDISEFSGVRTVYFGAEFESTSSDYAKVRFASFELI